MVKYIGSKRLLVPAILDAAASLSGVRTVFDVFSGTARVGHAFKKAGYRVIANDCLAFAHTLATCYVQADRQRVWRDAERIIAELNALPGRAGYVTEVFCRKARFFQPHNGERIDAMRHRIDQLDLDDELRAVVLTSLIEAADRVDSTTGVQMAYVKQWAPRSFNHIELRMPDVLPQARAGAGRALMADALDAARSVHADLAYLDPPYNQHSYLGNYHIWETIVRGDEPEHYGIACKRLDCRDRRSPFNSRTLAPEAMRTLIAAINARWIIVSFNNEGFIDRSQMEDLLAARGPVCTIEHPYKRYVGAKIGIHNPQGRRVGRVGRLDNTEYLFVVGPTTPAREHALAGVA
ncbi:MAG: DNA methyltransferase [Planctomycetota bacterium]|nr:MAG: DNA methyltransferase [Planctomycetota bacterium]